MAQYPYYAGPNLRKLFWFFKSPGDMPVATGVAERAMEWQAQFFTDRRFGGRNDEADAFRHCLTAALLTREIGCKRAKELLCAHESGWFNPSREREMDLHNNDVGIEIGMRYLQDREMALHAAKALIDGRLKVIGPMGLSSAFIAFINGALANPDRY